MMAKVDKARKVVGTNISPYRYETTVSGLTGARIVVNSKPLGAGGTKLRPRNFMESPTLVDQDDVSSEESGS